MFSLFGLAKLVYARKLLVASEGSNPSSARKATACTTSTANLIDQRFPSRSLPHIL
ncbi:hypothetical protein CBM2634_P140005 [Cupriavidus taiwanensis]|uniref:Uncharacterized protein n=1 Tax=Cupriavidus taiwanensis TaxID=164546 RepID=A0A375JC77_9BURK|nr:hypothetical protein CBM2634_P140005 [Cupriavidus taiwanensis]